MRRLDALGNPTRFTFTPGQACDLDSADISLPQITADMVIADKGFDADERVIKPLERAGKVLSSTQANRKHERHYDKDCTKRVTLSRISSPNSSSSAPSPPDMTGDSWVVGRLTDPPLWITQPRVRSDQGVAAET
jgi:hypothetical protein